MCLMAFIFGANNGNGDGKHETRNNDECKRHYSCNYHSIDVSGSYADDNVMMSTMR